MRSAPATLAADLLLARLLPPAKRPPSPARLRTDVARFFRTPPSDEHWQEVIDGLVDAGLLDLRPLRLTEAGRSRALAFLGVSELPPRCNWGTIQAKFLVPKALRLATTSPAELKRLGKTESLAALLLKERYKLSVGPQPSLGQVFEALACRKLGFPDVSTLEDLKLRVLSRLAGSEERMDAGRLRKTLPRVLLGAKAGGIRGLRAVVLASWADSEASPTTSTTPSGERPRDEAAPAELDLPAFARTVKAAARDCPTGRFGDNKVFINHLWRHLRDEPSFPVRDLAAFKQHLTEANQTNLLTLSRADLVQLMDPADVEESLTRYLNGEFHFVLVEREPS
jgi:hypothetical protein